MVNFNHLTTFIRVVAEGSMTAAAEKLFLTQPAVSQQIRALEEELGVDLLVRGIRQIKPTLQGQMLYERSKEMLQLLQQLEVDVKTMGGSLKGSFRVGTLNSIGLSLISPMIGRLLRHNPELQLKVDYRPGEALMEDFEDGKLDALILPRVEAEFNRRLERSEERFLFREEMWLVGNGRDKSTPRTISMKDYGSKPTVLFRSEFPNFFRKLNEFPVEPVFESSNVGTLKKVIESGLGWGFLPSQSIKKQVRLGRLTKVDVSDLQYQFDLCYYTQSSQSKRTMVDVFYQVLMQED